MAEGFPPMSAIESTMISSAGYDADAQALYLRYVKGGVYRYDAVPQGVWAGLHDAESAGTYLRQHVLGTYRFQKVEE